MRSKIAFLLIVSAVVVSVLSLIIGLENGLSGRGQGMSGMTPRALWIVLIVAPLIAAIAVLGYIVVFPELEAKQVKEQPSLPIVETGKSPLDAVLRVLKEDEQRVIEALVAEGGTILQKDIRWKTGFSRVKIHRILSRLVERGIVSAEKYYNTNKITLADWLLKHITRSRTGVV